MTTPTIQNRLGQFAPTHKELVERAVKWLLGKGGCSIAFSELSTSAFECPDAIGFNCFGSTVVECKISRSDFAADKRKSFRRSQYLGMGWTRYYMVPENLVDPEEITTGWGLLYVNGRHVRVIKKPGSFIDRNYRNEIKFLVSMLRRVKVRLGRQNDVLNQWLKMDGMVKRPEDI